MLVDSALFEGDSQLVVENVGALPTSTVQNAMVYLTVQSGTNKPGLYMRQSSSWVLLSDSDPVI